MCVVLSHQDNKRFRNTISLCEILPQGFRRNEGRRTNPRESVRHESDVGFYYGLEMLDP